MLLFCAGYRINGILCQHISLKANHTVLRPFLQPESPLSSRVASCETNATFLNNFAKVAFLE